MRFIREVRISEGQIIRATLYVNVGVEEKGNPLGLCLSLCLSFHVFFGADDILRSEICHQHQNSLRDCWADGQVTPGNCGSWLFHVALMTYFSALMTYFSALMKFLSFRDSF